MKAEELLRLYDAGRRDFSGENLRGQNFKGQNLSEVDFSDADIRSANFTRANLRSANFRGTIAGLQHCWTISLFSFSWLLAGLAGFFSGYVGVLVALINDVASLEYVIFTWIALIAIVVSSIIAIQKVFGSGLDAFTGAVLFAVLLTIFFTVSVVAIGTGDIAIIFASDVAILFTIAITIAVTVAIAVRDLRINKVPLPWEIVLGKTQLLYSNL